MKILILLLIPILSFSQKKDKYWYKQSFIVTNMVTAGWLHAKNEIAVHHYFKYANKHPKANPQWHNPKLSFRNKYKNYPTDMSPKYFGSTTVLAFTTDAYHLRSTIKNSLFACNIGISLTLYEKVKWKHILIQSLTNWGSYAVGTGLAHYYYNN